MSRLLKVLLCGMVLAAWTGRLTAQELTETQKAQNKLLAHRAARVDAIRKLAERINGLRITSQTTVKDFITTSDRIRTAMESFLAGMREAGEPKFMADGTCEVTVEVTLAELIAQLELFHKSYYKGDNIRIEDFRKMTVTNELKVISETGSGAPRPPEWFGGEMVAVGGGAPAPSDLPEGMSRKAAAYWMSGKFAPNARLMAMRAARLDGMRKLAERIKGVYITSNTTVQDFITTSDQIRTVTDTILRGAREDGIRYHDNEPIVEVRMAVTLRTVYETVKSSYEAHYKADQVRLREFEERIREVKDSVITETGMGVAEVKEVEKIVAVVAENKNNWPPALRSKGNAAIDAANPNAAQAKLMAFRGAELDARRKLAEQIDGLRISSKTTVQDFIAQSDEIRTAMRTFQQNVRVLDDSKRVLADGTVEVEVEVDPQPLWDLVIFYQKKLSLRIE